jgi:deoxyribodipyrimidine photo-lyase
MVKKIGLYIFRRDLRLTDNLALNLLAKQVDEIIPIFILDPNQIKKNNKNKYHFSESAVQFICECLINLNEQLHEYNSQLYLFMGEADKIVNKLINELNIDYVGFNLDFSPYAQKRDTKIISICDNKKIPVITSDCDLTLLPTDLLLNNGKPFKVYGSFYKHAVKFKVNKPERLPKVDFSNHISVKGNYPINKLKNLYTENKNLDQRGGLIECMKRINNIKKQKKYNIMRDRLDYETTHLSAYLNMGIISRRQIYHIFKSKLGNKTQLLKQCYWADFYLIAFRFIDNANSYKNYIDTRFDKIKWRKSSEFKKEFNTFWNSQTGLLVIDAAIKQLRTTGYMHNRARMICVIYTCKYLMINMLDPKWGSQCWYSRSLVDCMGSSNNKLNNNWALDFDLTGRRFGTGISGRGMDVSNEKTIKDFDPDGNYIKKWLPHLKDVPIKDLKNWDKEIAEKYDNIHPYFKGDLKQMYLRWFQHTKTL